MTTADKIRRLTALETSIDKQQSTATAAVYKAFREGEPAPDHESPVYELVTSNTEK